MMGIDRARDHKIADSGALTALTRSIGLFFVILFLVSGPAFFGQWYSSSEEQVSLFGAAYDLRLFFPGSNRMVMVLPIITSWLGTPMRIAIAHFAIIVVSISAALAGFAYVLPRVLFYAFSLSALFAIIVLFGGDAIYSFYLSPVHPYLVPFALAVICYAILTTTSPRTLLSSGLIIVVLVLTIAAAGYNPAASLLLATFFGLRLFVAFIARASTEPSSVSALGRHALRTVLSNKNLVLGTGLNLVAMAVALWSSGWYQRHFPQYVRSNYSVESYTNSGISLVDLWQAFAYLIEFHERGGLFGSSITRWLIGAVLLSGFGSLALWWLRQKANPYLVPHYRNAFLLWASAMLVIVVVSQNAHVQLVPNFIRGRYFTLPYYAAILSLCLTVATVWVDLTGRWTAWRHAGKAWPLAVMLTVTGSWIAHAANWGVPTLNPISPSNAYVPLARQIQAAQVPAILGNYWWIWQLQYELNYNAAGKPRVTPVSIRTEGFGLNAFSPVVDALANAKSFRFACIEMKDPPPGLGDGCQQQIDFYRLQGGFPLGKINELGHSEIDQYKLTLYELGLEHPDDPADCTASDILLRARPVANSTPGQDTYSLDENSFIYLQRPAARDEWVLKFTSKAGEEVVSIPRETRTLLHLLRHRIEVIGGRCRLLVTVSHQEGLYPKTMQLAVH